MADELHNATASDLASELAAGRVSSEEVTRAVIARAEAVDERVGAFLHRDAENAVAQARASDLRRRNGETRGPLDGIPVSLKDAIATLDQPMRCASRILENFVSPYDATVTRRLKDAGAVLWGRLNMDEFAMGSSTENSGYRATANPWDLERVPGGSSGGSAAAVAAGETILSLGSDTGGSIRQPAAFCGIVGLKPTYGLVSRYGLAAFASSLDQIGPMARSVEDTAVLLQVIAGHDRYDSTSWNAEVPDYVRALEEEPRRRRIGLPREFFGKGLDGAVRTRVEAVAEAYRENGFEVREVSLPHAAELALPVYYIIATAEASSNLARYDGIRYTRRSEGARDGIDLYFKTRGEFFGAEVKRRIILGTYVLSSGYYDAYYKRAQQVRTVIRREFERVFEEVDLLLTPTTPTPAFPRGDRIEDPLSMYLNDIYTLSVNLAGLPAISVPCGHTETGLPVGAQLIGPSFAEANLLAAAHVYLRDHPHHHERPPLA